MRYEIENPSEEISPPEVEEISPPEVVELILPEVVETYEEEPAN